MYVLGTKMDYVEDDLKSEFIFINPNSKVYNSFYNKIKYIGFLWLW